MFEVIELMSCITCVTDACVQVVCYLLRSFGA